MLLPPNELPEGLSPAEYQRLSVLYTVMGRQKQAAEASTRAFPESLESQGDSPEGTAEERAMAAGAALAYQLMDLIQRRVASSETSDAGGVESVKEIVAQLKGLGIKDEDLDAIATQLDAALGSAISDAATQGTPPRDVPTDLSAKEYYELGMRYKTVGWTEQARDALTLAMELDPGGEIFEKAQKFLRTRVPRRPVPLMAEQANVAAFNLMGAGKMDEARAAFEELIEKYPDFEWPYGNLGSIHVQDGNLELAEKVLIHAVQLNPYYVNAWLHLMRANVLGGKFQQAHYCLNKVREIDPEEDSLESLNLMLAKIESW